VRLIQSESSTPYSSPADVAEDVAAPAAVPAAVAMQPRVMSTYEKIMALVAVGTLAISVASIINAYQQTRALTYRYMNEGTSLPPS